MPSFCAHGSRGAEVNEADIIPVLTGEPDSKANIQMNKKLQSALKEQVRYWNREWLRSDTMEVTFKLRTGK